MLSARSSPRLDHDLGAPGAENAHRGTSVHLVEGALVGLGRLQARDDPPVQAPVPDLRLVCRVARDRLVCCFALQQENLK